MLSAAKVLNETRHPAAECLACECCSVYDNLVIDTNGAGPSRAGATTGFRAGRARTVSVMGGILSLGIPGLGVASVAASEQDCETAQRASGTSAPGDDDERTGVSPEVCRRVLGEGGCSAAVERDRAGASPPSRGCASSRDGPVVENERARACASLAARGSALQDVDQLWGRDALAEVSEVTTELGLDSGVDPGARGDGPRTFPALIGEPLGNRPPGTTELQDPTILLFCRHLVNLQRRAPAKPTQVWVQVAIRASSALLRACGSVEVMAHVHATLWEAEVGIKGMDAKGMEVFAPFISPGSLHYNQVIASRGVDAQFHLGERRRRKCLEPRADPRQRALLFDSLWTDFIEGGFSCCRRTTSSS